MAQENAIWENLTSFMTSMSTPWKISVAIIGVCLVLVALSMLSRPSPMTSSLKELIRQSAQLYETSRQDKDTALALQHSSEALAILSVARHLAADVAIEKASGIKVGELASAIASYQASCVAAISPREPSTASLAAGYAQL